MTVRLAQPMHDSAARHVEEIVAEHRSARPGLRSCSAPTQSALSPQDECNLQAKRAFRARVAVVLKGDSIRAQAKFFRVPHTTYNERITDRRTDLAPLAEWSDRLDSYEEFQRLTAEFSRMA